MGVCCNCYSRGISTLERKSTNGNNDHNCGRERCKTLAEKRRCIALHVRKVSGLGEPRNVTDVDDRSLGDIARFPSLRRTRRSVPLDTLETSRARLRRLGAATTGAAAAAKSDGLRLALAEERVDRWLVTTHNQRWVQRTRKERGATERQRRQPQREPSWWQAMQWSWFTLL